jgi:hypothetical protein
VHHELSPGKSAFLQCRTPTASHFTQLQSLEEYSLLSQEKQYFSAAPLLLCLYYTQIINMVVTTRFHIEDYLVENVEQLIWHRYVGVVFGLFNIYFLI